MSPQTLRIFCWRLSIPSAPLVKSRPTPSSPTLSTTSRLDSEPPRRIGTGMLRMLTSLPLRSAYGHTHTHENVRENDETKQKKIHKISQHSEKIHTAFSKNPRWHFKMSFFCSTNSPKLQNIQFKVIHNKERIENGGKVLLKKLIYWV